MLAVLRFLPFPSRAGGGVAGRRAPWVPCTPDRLYDLRAATWESPYSYSGLQASWVLAAVLSPI